MNSSISGATIGTNQALMGGSGTEAAHRGGVSAAGFIGAGEVSLGTNTGFGANPGPLSFPTASARLARAERYELQGVARAALGADHRIRGCLRYRHFGAATVMVRNRRDTGQAYYSGLQVCGVAAACPCCGARIAEERARRVDLAIGMWGAQGGQVALVTLTFSHHAGQALAPNLDALLMAYRALVRGGSYRRLKARYGLAHFIKGVELTWSAANGWHPHLHVLGFFVGAFDVVAFERELWALWSAQLGRVGRSCTRAHGLKVQQGFTNAHKYVTKIGRQWGLADELARANQKRGRGGSYSPPDLLRACRDGDLLVAPVLFAEYVDAMHGRHMFQWSAGLAAAVGLADERSDQEVAEGVDQADPILVELEGADWTAVRRARGIVRLLEVADSGEAEAVWSFVAVCWGSVAGAAPPALGLAASVSSQACTLGKIASNLVSRRLSGLG
jgi:hypothetical protein